MNISLSQKNMRLQIIWVSSIMSNIHVLAIQSCNYDSNESQLDLRVPMLKEIQYRA